jgi:hypothetical protein
MVPHVVLKFELLLMVNDLMVREGKIQDLNILFRPRFLFSFNVICKLLWSFEF